MTVSTEELNDACLDVLAMLIRDGWCRFRYIDTNGKRCLSQAITEVARERGWSEENFVFALNPNPLYQHILNRVQVIDPPAMSLSFWNDYPGRSFKDVVKVLADV